MSLMQEMGNRALKLGVPLSVQMDVTYRCNERCVHCYLDHDDHGEMTTPEIKDVLDQLADAGVFFLIFSGGEVFMRMDFFELLEYARAKMFSVKVKTNAFMIEDEEADRLAALNVESVQVSIYSHRPEVHDAITKLPRSLERSIAGIRRLRERGVKVTIANVLMRGNLRDYEGVKALADELGAHYTIDPTVTPMMDGDRSILSLGIDHENLQQIFRDESLVGNADEFCAPPPGPMDESDAMDTLPCSAGHTACYVSPYGDVYPCVQFPLPTGNLRQTKFMDIWQHSPELNEVRSITLGDIQGCSQCVHGSSCTRCPGLAYMEGNMRGPSIQDCEKSFARTGVPSVNLQSKKPAMSRLVQIQMIPAPMSIPVPIPAGRPVHATV
jgi:radical SAM protein with 4Fe4S-binding SPASM domain